MVVGSLTVETGLLIIGAGPGGYTAALKAAKHGRDVTVVDKNGELGGVCLHHGCIPTKTYIHSTNFGHVIRELEHCGVHVDDFDVNFDEIHGHKDEIVNELASGIQSLFDKHGVELIKGHAEFQDEESVHIRGQSDVNEISFDDCIIATGSKPIELPFLPFDNDRVLSSRGLLQLEHIPDSMVIVGGGYIGTEMGTVYGKLGTDVTIIERTDELIPVLPDSVVSVVADNLSSFDIDVHRNTAATSYDEDDDTAKLTVEHNGDEHVIEAEYVLSVVGREPNTDGLDLSEAGLTTDEHGFIPVNEHMQTREPSIYSVGDTTGQPLLAHKAVRQGKVAADHSSTGSGAYDNMVIPSVVFNDPEIACVGLTEDDAEQEGRDVITGSFNFKASGRAHTLSQPVGFVKVVADAETHRLLGVQSVGPQVSGMIGEATLAIELGAHVEDVAKTIHTHPTIPEALMSACEDAVGDDIHG